MPQRCRFRLLLGKSPNTLGGPGGIRRIVTWFLFFLRLDWSRIDGFRSRIDGFRNRIGGFRRRIDHFRSRIGIRRFCRYFQRIQLLDGSVSLMAVTSTEIDDPDVAVVTRNGFRHDSRRPTDPLLVAVFNEN